MSKKFSALPILLFALVGTAQADTQTITFGENGSSFFTTNGIRYTFENDGYPGNTVVFCNDSCDGVNAPSAEENWETNYLPRYRQTGYGSAEQATPTGFVTINQFELVTAIGALPNYPFASTSSFASSNGQLFDLNSLLLAGAFGTQTLTITGYANGVQVGNSVLVNVNRTAQDYSIGLLGIDTFTVAVGNNFVQTQFETTLGEGQYWTMASATVTAMPVPEPESWVMLLAGLGIVGAVARKRRAVM